MSESVTAPSNSLRTKAELLAHGIRISESALGAYGPPFITKRRAYGNQDPIALRDRSLPQELILGDERLVVAVNVVTDSPWSLEVSPSGEFIIAGPESNMPVSFPIQPAFYESGIDGGHLAKHIVTLYGGASLGVFAYGDCALVQEGSACQYCSVGQNRGRPNDFEYVVRPAQVRSALAAALDGKVAGLTQVMLNGGNFADTDRSFGFYAKLAEAARSALDAIRSPLDLHLIVFPPRDLSLIRELHGLDVSVAMNTEVFDADLYRRYAPGKHALGGQAHMSRALDRAVADLGHGRVYSIVVGGLEPFDGLNRGIRDLAARGVVPVINVFHADPETPLEGFPRPSGRMILEMGAALQSVYQEHDCKPFYSRCGRNSIDDEASRGMFY